MSRHPLYQSMTHVEIMRHFEQKLADLMAEARQLRERKQEGFGYRMVWRREHRVPEYSVKGHWMVVQTRPSSDKTSTGRGRRRSASGKSRRA
jgi:hypothetical protein